MKFELDYRTGMMRPKKDEEIYFAQSQGGGLIVDDKKNDIKYIIERDERITKLFGSFNKNNLNLYDMRDARIIADRVMRLLGRDHKYTDFHYFLRGYRMSESFIKNCSDFLSESIWSDMQDRSAGDVVRQEDIITTNEDLKYIILELYKEQGEGETLDVSSLTNRIKCDDFSYLFNELTEVKHIIGLEDWDVSNVKNMECMFCGCKNFNSDLSKWNVSNVENMSSMFEGCEKFNSDLSNWDVSSVRYMNGMFQGCEKFNSDLSKWNVSNVENMSSMFEGCEKFNSDLSNWDVNKVTNMSYMFNGCKKFNSNLSEWDVSGAGNMKCMFQFCNSFNSDLSNWNVSGVKNMGWMFRNCKKFNCDLSKWNVSNVEDMHDMFRDCIKFNCDLSKWNVSSVKNMVGMFMGCINFNYDLSKWDVSSVETIIIDMFDGCKSLKQIPSWYINR